MASFRWLALGLPVLLLLLFGAAVTARAWFSAEQWYVVEQGSPPRPDEPADLRDVSFRTADGVRLDGWFHPSSNGATVVLAHGFGQGRLGLLPEARILADAGYGLLLYDARGHGTSEGSVTLGYKEQLDLAAALAFVRGRPDVDPAHVGALGFSMGAVALAHVAAEDPELRAIVMLSPYPSLRKILAVSFDGWGPLSAFGARLAAWRRGTDFDAVRAELALPKLGPRAPLVIIGADEPGQHLMDQIEASLPPDAAMWRVPGAGHGGFIEVAPEVYPSRLLEYFGRTLRPPAATAL